MGGGGGVGWGEVPLIHAPLLKMVPIIFPPLHMTRRKIILKKKCFCSRQFSDWNNLVLARRPEAEGPSEVGPPEEPTAKRLHPPPSRRPPPISHVENSLDSFSDRKLAPVQSEISLHPSLPKGENGR